MQPGCLLHTQFLNKMKKMLYDDFLCLFMKKTLILLEECLQAYKHTGISTHIGITALRILCCLHGNCGKNNWKIFGINLINEVVYL